MTGTTANATPVSNDGLDQGKREHGNLQGIIRPEQRGTEGFTPNRGDLFEPMPENQAGPAGPDPDQGSLHEAVPGKQTDRPANLATEDKDDLYQMAEEVFAGLTIDDWAIIRNVNDPFDNRDPFRDGVKWVPGLGTLPASP